MNSAFSATRTWIVVAIASAALTVGTAQFIAGKEVQTASNRWQDILNHTSATQAAKVEDWLATQREALVTAATNPSLQLYFMQAKDAGNEAPAEDYLGNYLTATSANLGLQAPTNPMIKNDALVTDGGVALLDNEGTIIAASQGLPALNTAWTDHAKSAPRGETTLIDITQSHEGVLQMGYLVPVYGMQMDPSPEAQVGYLLSIIPVNQTLAPMLVPTASTSGVDVLLTRAGNEVINVGATHPIHTDALTASHTIEGTPWTLVAATDKSIAMGDVIRWHTTLLFAAVFAALATTAIAHAIWHKRNQEGGVSLQSMNRVATLLSSLADQQDPHANQHSETVATISRAIAEQMELSIRACETTEMAAKLMNIGKANVPKELLTRTTELKPEELFTIRSSLVESADILEGIDLDGPVVDTLRQTQEYMNGTGPKKLRGKRILISARIISVVNAFVAMTSPRAYRGPMSVERALEVLAEDNGTRFDPAVIGALNEYIKQGGASVLTNRTQSGPSMSIAS